VAANASAPSELAALFAPYIFLLHLNPMEHANAFAAGEQAPWQDVRQWRVSMITYGKQACALWCLKQLLQTE